jgi:hypothetical protein
MESNGDALTLVHSIPPRVSRGERNMFLSVAFRKLLYVESTYVHARRRWLVAVVWCGCPSASTSLWLLFQSTSSPQMRWATSRCSGWFQGSWSSFDHKRQQSNGKSQQLLVVPSPRHHAAGISSTTPPQTRPHQPGLSTPLHLHPSAVGPQHHHRHRHRHKLSRQPRRYSRGLD